MEEEDKKVGNESDNDPTRSVAGQPAGPEWLNSVRDNLPYLQEIAKECEEPFRVKCFEILLAHSLQMSEGNLGLARIAERQAGSVTQEVGAHARYENFLRQRNLTHESMKRLIDFESGEILVAGLGVKKAEVQRKLASLVSVFSLAKSGELAVPWNDLKRVCERAGVYDPGNFAAYMKNARYRNSVVFVEEQNGWKVTTPGEGFVSDTINELLHSLG